MKRLIKKLEKILDENPEIKVIKNGGREYQIEAPGGLACWIVIKHINKYSLKYTLDMLNEYVREYKEVAIENDKIIKKLKKKYAGIKIYNNAHLDFNGKYITDCSYRKELDYDKICTQIESHIKEAREAEVICAELEKVLTRGGK